MRRLTVRLIRSPAESLVVGDLAEQDRRIYFEYATDFLATGLSLSPFKLPARAGLIEHTDHAFGPLPGLFDDSLPDGWGLLLMNRHFRRQGIDPHTLSPLARLTWLGTGTMGALTYHPPDEVDADEALLDLRVLCKNAEEVLEGDAAELLPQLLRTGGSPGGARPKVLVGIRDERLISGVDDLPEGYAHWIVKFAARADARDAGPVEYAYALMAGAAGIDMPEVRLLEVGKTRRYFGVRRFDRLAGNRRVHVHTFGNMIHADFRVPSLDYADLFKVTRALTRSHREVLRVFRSMVFNVCAHVRDDHAKNFAFMLNDEGDWTLTPAYDLIWSQGPGGEHTMTVFGEGRRPIREHCLTLAGDFGVNPQEADGICSEVNAAIERWPEFAARAACSARATSKVTDSLQRI